MLMVSYHIDKKKFGCWQAMSKIAILLTILQNCHTRNIVFKNDLNLKKCDKFAGEIFWEEDQQCHKIGERGPCQEGEVFSIVGQKGPFCKLTSKVTNRKSAPSIETKNIVEFEDNQIKIENNVTCQGDRVKWTDGECYQLASTGPCEGNQWFVLDSIKDGQPVAKCKERKCEEGSVWLTGSCSCALLKIEESNVKPKSGLKPRCKEGEQLVVSPYGDGVCAVNIEDSLDNRIFELLKDGTASINCYVDENGRCRQKFEFKGRFDDYEEEEDKNTENSLAQLILWLEQFEKPSPDNCTDVGEKENIHVVSAEEVVQDISEVSLVTDDHALTNLEEANITCPSNSMSWIDGECYQLASTGPCEDSQWFVLDSIVDGRPVVKCKDRKCEEESVWFSKACSCVPLDLEDSNVTLKTGMESLCQEGTQIVVSPYGDGVCAVNIEKSLDNRIFELLKDGSASINCYVDENGRCRKKFELGGRIDIIEVDEELEEDSLSQIEWLEQFAKPSENECTDLDQKKVGQSEVIEVPAKNESISTLEEECHRQGKVLFEGEGCYNLLERGPCFEQSMWLVMTIQAGGGMEPVCQERICSEDQSVWDPQTCQCGNHEDTCDDGEQLYLDIFGQGVCGCKPGYHLWAEDGSCYQDGEVGPCDDNQAFSFDPESGTKLQ